ncbi:polysaccharide biosynthesis tyrosine autokinase [Mycolicibacterium sp. P1-18]|uniref:polysaccharide biosynthesis tyrosine autokinase n=1 Tax=Mycolicibacterium sp. P1-18 TaxID=2024615 RepID=UPI0011F35FFA|nr:polysaccharide biosynthesis tyrosine autokinase [Mycolicibacterium sp. P1-18]KAA0098822.1 polysaccharide biosynthesis tyrosine autokinase [Mycolicibacterium sp. P1-18]
MTVQDFARILRTRWVVIFGAIVIAVLAAVAYGAVAPKQYEASTRLFVSTTSDGTNTQTNDGGLFAQRRVLSYTQLLTSEILAQRTVDKLGLDMTATDLRHEVTATAPTDTVVIDVTVRDHSAARARDIANTLSDEFVVMAAGLETPDLGARPNARVVVQQRANIPDDPVAPKTLQLLAIAAVAGALIGLLVATVLYLLDDTVRLSEDLEKATGVGEVGNIPLDRNGRKEPLLAFDGDRPVLADAFRELRVNLQALEVADGPRVLLVASPMPGEGRTTTAVNLALALAETGMDVVVVDGDLRRPAVASCLGVDGQVGVSTVLADRATVDEALQQTQFPRVTVLASGAVPASPTELLGSPNAKELLRALAERFDYVVVDSPSLVVKDAGLLAGSAQGVLIVARYGQSKRKQMASATTTLARAGAPLLGAVLTMTRSPKKGSADSYYGRPADVSVQGRHSGPQK